MSEASFNAAIMEETLSPNVDEGRKAGFENRSVKDGSEGHGNINVLSNGRDHLDQVDAADSQGPKNDGSLKESSDAVANTSNDFVSLPDKRKVTHSEDIKTALQTTVSASLQETLAVGSDGSASMVVKGQTTQGLLAPHSQAFDLNCVDTEQEKNTLYDGRETEPNSRDAMVINGANENNAQINKEGPRASVGVVLEDENNAQFNKEGPPSVGVTTEDEGNAQSNKEGLPAVNNSQTDSLAKDISGKTKEVVTSADRQSNVLHDSRDMPLLSAKEEVISLQENVENRRVGESHDDPMNIDEPKNNQQEITTWIGRKVSKKFGRKKFWGEVASYDSETRWFKVVYEDNDSEDLEMFEVERILIPVDSVKTPTSTKRKFSDTQSNEKTDSSVAVRKSKRLELESSAKSQKEQSAELAVVNPAHSTQSKRKRTRRRKSGKKGKKMSKKGSKKGTSKGAKSRSKTPKKGSKERQKKKLKLTPSIKTTNKKGLFDKSPESTGTLGKGSKAKVVKKAIEKAERDSSVVPYTFKDATSLKRKSIGMIQSGDESENHKQKKQKTIRNLESPVYVDPMLGQVRYDSGNPYLGRRVKKDFGGKLLAGIVVGHTLYYRVTYDDGDSEDLSIKELMQILSPEQGSSYPEMEKHEALKGNSPPHSPDAVKEP
eukprot:TRINITY_DN633_c0_g1_i1.p1 TRINITY_DN633_c0_g1~~TRINITY_DN633_c0_g1_i1.p1  ORF type:complete len:659 (+),score=164.48 TRINITY_DN633_c0_g1_i1:388-2364(+)